jgi:hypothetical protein
MGTWLVKVEGMHKGKYVSYNPAKYIGNCKKGKQNMIVVSWTIFTASDYFYNRPFYTQSFPADICRIYRKPGPREQKIRDFFKRLFTFKNHKDE